MCGWSLEIKAEVRDAEIVFFHRNARRDVWRAPGREGFHSKTIQSSKCKRRTFVETGKPRMSESITQNRVWALEKPEWAQTEGNQSREGGRSQGVNKQKCGVRSCFCTLGFRTVRQRSKLCWPVCGWGQLSEPWSTTIPVFGHLEIRRFSAWLGKFLGRFFFKSEWVVNGFQNYTSLTGKYLHSFFLWKHRERHHFYFR